MTQLSLRLLIPVVLSLALAPTPALAEDPPVTGVVELSERDVKYFARQFKAKCALCHGKLGDGAGANASAQIKPPANFTDAAFMATRTDAELFDQIFRGGKDVSAMPAFGEGSAHNWPNEKIWKMVSFVRAFAKDADASPAGEAVPAPQTQSTPKPILPETVRPGVAFYSDDFATEGNVRGLLQEKNLEEVYQNYRYYEAWYDEANRVVKFKEYLRGDVVCTETYAYHPDGTLKERRVKKPGEKTVKTQY